MSSGNTEHPALEPLHPGLVSLTIASIDVTGNQFQLNGQRLVGRHRWEVAVLNTLLQASQKHPDRFVTRLELEHQLAAAGQPFPLNRSQWMRLWASLERSIDAVIGNGAFRARFQHLPRCRTVGPWRWRPLALDGIAASAEPAGPTCRLDEAPLLHRITAKPNWRAALALLRKLAVCHVVWSAGSRAVAVEEFRKGSEWEAASPELQVHRSLFIADALVMLFRFDEADQEVASALTLIQQHPECRDQAAYAAFLASVIPSLRIGDEASPVMRRRMWACLSADLGGRNQFDYTSRAWTLNIIGRSYALSAGDDHGSGAESLALAHCLAVHEAAITCALLAGRWDVLCSVLDCLAANLGIIAKRADEAVAVLALETHLCSRFWRYKLDPADSLSTGEFWLGELWCSHPSLAAHAESMQRSGLWVGLRPDTAEFVAEMVRHAEKTDDPMSIARSALVAYKLSALRRSSAEMARHRAALIDQLRQHPELLKRLQASSMLDSGGLDWIAEVGA